MGIVFPSDQIRILDFNRLFKTLSGRSSKNIIKNIKNNFNVKKLGKIEAQNALPTEKYHYSMYIGKEWYKLILKPELIPYAG